MRAERAETFCCRFCRRRAAREQRSGEGLPRCAPCGTYVQRLFDAGDMAYWSQLIDAALSGRPR